MSTQAQPIPTRFVTVQEAAAILGMSADNLYQIISDGKIPAYRVMARSIRLNLADLVRPHQPKGYRRKQQAKSDQPQTA